MRAYLRKLPGGALIPDDDEAVEVKIEEELSELDQIRADLAALIQPKSKTKVTKPAAEEEKPKAKKAGRQVKIGA